MTGKLTLHSVTRKICGDIYQDGWSKRHCLHMIVLAHQGHSLALKDWSLVIEKLIERGKTTQQEIDEMAGDIMSRDIVNNYDEYTEKE